MQGSIVEGKMPEFETIADGSYPVSRGLYIYVNDAKVADNPALAGYVDHYLGAGYSEGVTEAFGHLVLHVVV